jgi:hypothetical protein
MVLCNHQQRELVYALRHIKAFLQVRAPVVTMLVPSMAGILSCNETQDEQL